MRAAGSSAGAPGAFGNHDRESGKSAEKYAELAGGSAADGPALAAAIASAMDTLCPETNAGLHIDLTFRPEPTGVVIEIRCQGRSTTVRHLLSAEKR